MSIVLARSGERDSEPYLDAMSKDPDPEVAAGRHQQPADITHTSTVTAELGTRSELTWLSSASADRRGS